MCAWYILEKSFAEIIDYNNNLKSIIAVSGDLAFNKRLAQELINNRDEYLKSDTIIYTNYKTKAIDEFIYSRPFSFDSDLYFKLQELNYRMFEVNNKFLEQVRNGHNDNKERVLNNAIEVNKAAGLLLYELDSERLRLEKERKINRTR